MADSNKDSISSGSGKRTTSSPLSSFLRDDCDRPACDDTKSALTAALERVGRAKSNVAAVGGKTSAKEGTPDSYRSCPPTRDEIGVSTWSLLHSMAAWYPNQPSSQDEQFMSDFMKALARFYPCTWCASDFQRNIELSPPK
eukprot:scaffold323_cov188-Alexandrium_tamarense.AAC.4